MIQDVFGLICSIIFCILLAIVQGVLIGTVYYVITNNVEIPFIKKMFLNSTLPIILIGYEFFKGKNNEEKDNK